MFELPSLKMSLICSYLQYLFPSFVLIILVKMFLLNKTVYGCRGKSRPVRLGLFSPVILVNQDLSSLYLPGYLEWSSRLRLQSFLWNRFAIQRKSWFPRKLWPCYGKSVSVVPFLYQLLDVFDDNASRNSNHYASADFVSVFSIFYFTFTV